MEQMKTIAEAWNSARDLTKWYLVQIPEDRVTERIEANGQTFNSAYWMANHVAFTQYWLVVRPFSGKDPEWEEIGKTYRFGNPGDVDTSMPYRDVYRRMKGMHQRTLTLIESLPDSILDEPTKLNFLDFKTNRDIFYHAIRHEGVHAGQLSWLSKLMGVKTI